MSVSKERIALSLVLSAACAVIFKDFLVGDKVYLFRDIGSDSINTYFPWLVNVSDTLHAHRVPAWSFAQGVGQNLFPFWLSDPFSVLLALVFARPLLPFGLVWMEVVKILLCGLIFHAYLGELKVQGVPALLGAFAYGLCGYVIVGSGWTIFSVEAVYAALVLWGFERWLNRGQWLILVGGIGLLGLLQPFFLFPYGLFLTTYAVLRYSQTTHREWSAFPKFALRTLGLILLGVAAGAYQFLPDVLQYVESPRVGGQASLSTLLRNVPIISTVDDTLGYTTIARAFSSDLLGTGSQFKGWQNYLESPVFYCGLLNLMVFPQLWASQRPRRERFGYAIFVLFWLLPLTFPYLRYMFWAFTGDYFRTLSLLVTIIVLVGAAVGLQEILKSGQLNRSMLVATFGVFVVLLYTPPDSYERYVDSTIRTIITVLLAGYGLLLISLSCPGWKKQFGLGLLLLMCCTEMMLLSARSINERVVVTRLDLQQRIGYNDFTLDALKRLSARDPGWYRIDKGYSSGLSQHASLNDAKVQRYSGLASYNSFNQINYVRFLGQLEVIDERREEQTRWISGPGNRYLLSALLGGKYWLTKATRAVPPGPDFELVDSVQDIRVYRNPFALPLGFTYDQVTDESTLRLLSPGERDFNLLKACVVADRDAELVSDITHVYPTSVQHRDAAALIEQVAKDISDREREALVLSHFDDNRIAGQIEVMAPRILFLSIPYDLGWHIKVNGEPAHSFRANYGFIGVLIKPGRSTVELEFTPRFMTLGTMISLVSIVCIVLAAIRIAPRRTVFSAG